MKFKWLNTLTLSFLLTLVSLYIYSIDLTLFHTFELKSYDFKVRSRGVRPIGGQVVIIAIDEASLKQQGRWPWPRTILAHLVDRASEAGAAVIGFDIFFPEKDVYVPLATVEEAMRHSDLRGMDSEAMIAWLKNVGDSDRNFAAALDRSERSVLGYFVYSSDEKENRDAVPLDPEHLALLEFSQYSIVQRNDSPEHPVDLRPIQSAGMSLQELMIAANSAGFVSFIPAIDGVVRWVPLVMKHGEFLFPPLSLQILHETLKVPLGLRIASYGVDQVRLGDRVIPTSENGDFLVNYYGPPHTFTHYSASDVLSGKVGPKELQDKIVLIGGTAAGTYDIHTTPYGTLYPGVEVHANVMENVLQGDFLLRPQWLRVLDVSMILVSGILLGLASRRLKAIGVSLLLFAGVGGYLALDHFLFTQKGLWIDSVYPIFTQVFVFTGIIIYRFVFEEREKRFIRGAFGQYLAPSVVDQLTENPSLLKLGGEKKVLTAFFSDVAGFSTISEKLTPEQLVELLNDYLTEMTDIIHKYEGTVDKFEGDAIIAFFGAPVPFEDHARRTCFASLDMQNRLRVLREDLKNQGKHELFMRIGINTGPMVVGNMGSKSRMDYTMMGDAVNLAARLEGVNKQYKTYTMISQFTYEHVKDDVETRELDMIRVVGKKERIIVYELLGRKGEIDDLLRGALPAYYRGLEAYKARRWQSATDLFEQALKVHPSDGPSQVYLERCRSFIVSPPAPDWDGVYVMTSK